MKAIIVLTVLISLILSCDSTEPVPEPKTYTLIMSISGQGSVEVNPIKSEYSEGEIVTLIASPDSGWGFVQWTGSLTSEDNPMLLTMNSNKNIIAIFGITYSPDITGKWRGVELLIVLDLTQSTIFASDLTGIMTAELVSGDTVIYSVTGQNTPPTITMIWNRTGFFPITYNGVWKKPSIIEGVMEENNVTWDLDFVRIVGASPTIGNKRFPFGKKESNN